MALTTNPQSRADLSRARAGNRLDELGTLLLTQKGWSQATTLRTEQQLAAALAAAADLAQTTEAQARRALQELEHVLQSQQQALRAWANSLPDERQAQVRDMVSIIERIRQEARAGQDNPANLRQRLRHGIPLHPTRERNPSRTPHVARTRTPSSTPLPTRTPHPSHTPEPRQQRTEAVEPTHTPGPGQEPTQTPSPAETPHSGPGHTPGPKLTPTLHTPAPQPTQQVQPTEMSNPNPTDQPGPPPTNETVSPGPKPTDGRPSPSSTPRKEGGDRESGRP